MRRAVRRPRAVWLVESADPSGATVMAWRRADVLRDRLDSTLVAVSRPVARPPVGSPLAALPRLSTLGAEAVLARADLVLTTSERALAAAVPRLPPRGRLVHFLHAKPERHVGAELFQRRIGAASLIATPPAVDRLRLAADIGVASDRLRVADDFAEPATGASAPESAGRPRTGRSRPRRLLAVGRLPSRTAVLDLVAALDLAREALHGWQLVVAGWGPGLAELSEQIDRRRLGTRVLLLGARHDVQVLLSRVDYTVRLDDGDVNGLSVVDSLAAGVPVIVSATVPAAGRVETGVSGWVLEQADPRTLSEQLSTLVEPALQARLAAGAAAHRVSAPGPSLAARAALHALIDDALAAPPATAALRALR